MFSHNSQKLPGLIATDAKKERFVKPKRSNTLLIWSGPSVLDGSPIGLFATIKSRNSKTGDMVQLSILRTDQNPVQAQKTGQDSAICGNCPQRPSVGGACYVKTGQGPNNVYKAYKRGNIDSVLPSDDVFKNAKIRLGSYGDPAAIPYEVLESITKNASLVTGYTHQARHKNFDPRVSKLCMISTETVKQTKAMQNKGFHTFRIKAHNEPLLDNEIECLSDTKGIQCKDCGLCNGQQVSVAINVHGALKGRFTKMAKSAIVGKT